MSLMAVLLLAFLSVCGCHAASYYATVYLHASEPPTLKFGRVVDTKNGAAVARFDDTMDTTGWGVLEVQTSPTSPYDDNQRMYAAGYIEGYLTFERIGETYASTWSNFFQNATTAPTRFTQFFAEQQDWTNTMIKEHAGTAFWDQIGFTNQQLMGLADGCNAARAAHQLAPLSLFAFQLLQGVGDMLDLEPALDPSQRVDFTKMDADEFERWTARHAHCSGLIKLLPDMSDLFAAHSSWFEYIFMNRIYKHYSLHLSASFVATGTMSFSSYPGFLVSLDDFYIMDSGLTMVQTTNGIINQTLYDLVQPKSLFAWQRVRAANSLAKSGSDWYETVKQFNSGTYNNQYMVVDYNLFSPGEPLVPNTLWVMEQIPGLVVGADTTHELEFGYFASYNVPYFVEIFNKSGYPLLKNTAETWQLAARAQIFRRDQATVSDITSLKALMRQNEFKTDPIAQGNPCRAICCRGDLSSKNPGPFGCYDSKVTSSEWAAVQKSEAINGPTQSHGLPAFSWAEFPQTEYHHGGQPSTFDFTFEPMQPQGFSTTSASDVAECRSAGQVCDPYQGEHCCDGLVGCTRDDHVCVAMPIARD